MSDASEHYLHDQIGREVFQCFIELAEEHHLSLEAGIEVLRMFMTNMLGNMRFAAIKAGVPHPEGRLWFCMSEIMHAMAHVPLGMDKAGDEWLRAYCVPRTWDTWEVTSEDEEEDFFRDQEGGSK